MYPRYNIPQQQINMQRNNMQYTYPTSSTYPTNYSNGDRFIGGGFVAPFLLGGIAGSVLTRPNYPIYTPGPPVMYYPPYRPYPNYYY